MVRVSSRRPGRLKPCMSGFGTFRTFRSGRSMSAHGENRTARFDPDMGDYRSITSSAGTFTLATDVAYLIAILWGMSDRLATPPHRTGRRRSIDYHGSVG